MRVNEVGYILTLIGGILGVLAGFLMIGMVNLFSQVSTMLPMMSTMGFVIGWIPGFWMIISGGLVIWAATMINSKNKKTMTMGGILALIFSVFGFMSILGIVGGILGIIGGSQK